MGYLNLQSRNELIYKHGNGKINKKQIAWTDHRLMVHSLSKYGVVAIGDLIHDICTVRK